MNHLNEAHNDATTDIIKSNSWPESLMKTSASSLLYYTTDQAVEMYDYQWEACLQQTSGTVKEFFSLTGDEGLYWPL